MNRRQFFQGIVAVTVAPDLKPPLMMPKVRYYDVCSAYPEAMVWAFHAKIARELKESLYQGGRVVYADTDGVFIVGGQSR